MLGSGLSGVSGIAINQDGYQKTGTGLRAMLRGGAWNQGTSAGRLFMDVSKAPSYYATDVGGRCVR